jgi:hypothetical protein
MTAAVMTPPGINGTTPNMKGSVEPERCRRSASFSGGKAGWQSKRERLTLSSDAERMMKVPDVSEEGYGEVEEDSEARPAEEETQVDQQCCLGGESDSS